MISGRLDLHNILLLVGPTRAGKGVISRILGGLVGTDNVAGPTLLLAERRFGLAPLLGKSLAVVSDARLNGKGEHTVVERLLSVAQRGGHAHGESQVPRPVDGKLPTRIMLCSNELPQLGDAAAAIAGRSVQLLTRSWLGREDYALELELRAEEGLELLSRRVTNDPEALRAIFAELGGDALVALEAAFGWEWLADLLEAEGIELHLAHPRQTKAIAAARVKTDAVDARTLAHLLRADLLPEAYVAPRELRQLRELLRHHIGLTRVRTALKNRVHALLARQGVQRGRAELFGPRGRAFLGELALPEPTRRRLESLLALIADFDRELAAVKREIQACAKNDPRVCVLTRIPGVGNFIALLVIAEVGDVNRFPSARQLASFAGLTPRVRNSGERVRLGSISDQGSPHLRWGLIQAAQTAVQADGPLKAFYERIKHRRGSKVAKVAVAREILTLCYYGLRDGEIRRLEAAAARANSALALAPTGGPTG